MSDGLVLALHCLILSRASDRALRAFWSVLRFRWAASGPASPVIVTALCKHWRRLDKHPSSARWQSAQNLTVNYTHNTYYCTNIWWHAETHKTLAHTRLSPTKTHSPATRVQVFLHKWESFPETIDAKPNLDITQVSIYVELWKTWNQR